MRMLSHGKTISKRPEAALRSVQKVKQLNANHREGEQSTTPKLPHLWCEGWMTFKWWNSMSCYDIIKVIYLRYRFAERNSKKSSWPVTVLWNRRPLKDLNDSKLIHLIIQDQFYTMQNLQRYPIPQTSNWSGTFFAVSYSKPALL